MYFVRTLAALTVPATSVAASSFIASVSYENTKGSPPLILLSRISGMHKSLLDGTTRIAGPASPSLDIQLSLSILHSLELTLLRFWMIFGRAVELGRVNVTAMPLTVACELCEPLWETKKTKWNR
ncbi:hypothetical protein K439DRAFT_1639746 [Ramaria rubella]|nr:hypothetical protein K439DRAFT_1639746 [Ramaria rubella]